jgi:lantibiotic modifying enzyme
VIFKITVYKPFLEIFEYESFFESYPYLTRLIFTKIDYIKKNINFLLKQIRKDFNLLGQKIFQDQDYKFDEIKLSVSDKHNFGQSVILLTTNKNKKVIFKYRDGDIDVKFNKILISILKECKLKLDYPLINIITKNKYHWVSFFENIPCKEQHHVNEYYQKIGVILFIFYLFETVDIHNENLVSSASNPFLVDLETLFSGNILLNRPYLNKLTEVLENKYGFSILRSGMLPNYSEDSNGNIRNNSAISDGKDNNIYIKLLWKNIGKDNICFEYIASSELKTNNLLYLESSIVSI